MPRILASLVVAVLFAACQSSAALAQAGAPPAATLSPDAQDAIKKGVAAAQDQDYPLAIRFFQDARKTSPGAPEIYYDLGLAESKIPGRELRAIAWFGAYLAANPNASNAAAVNDFIVALQVKSQSNLGRLLKTAQDAASQAESDSFSRDADLGRVAGLWAQAGDVTAAMKVVASFGDGKDNEIGYQAIAEGQAKAGDMDGAKKTAGLIVKIGIFKSDALGAIAFDQAKTGDLAGAKITFASALVTAGRIQDGPVNGIPAHPREQALGNLIVLQSKIGDIAGAQKTLELWPNNYPVDQFTWDAIATAQATAGDTAGAQKTVDAISDANIRQSVRLQLATGYRFPAVTQRPPVVSDWLKALDDADNADTLALNTDPFLDLAGFLKALPSSAPLTNSTAPQLLFSGIYDAAEKIATAQNVIDQMLKRQTHS